MKQIRRQTAEKAGVFLICGTISGIAEKVVPLHIEKPMLWKGSQRWGKEIHSILPSTQPLLKEAID
jgi:hypothetical protein